MKKGLWCVLMLMLTIALCMSNAMAATKAQEVRFVVAGPMYPQYGDAFGLNMYFNALVGASKNHPDLKGIIFKAYDKGMLFSSQDDCVKAIASGAAQMTYASPQHLEQIAPEFRLFSTPGYVLSWDHFLRVINTPT